MYKDVIQFNVSILGKNTPGESLPDQPNCLPSSAPKELTQEELEFACIAIHEELSELVDAGEVHDVSAQADALIDIIYFTLGKVVDMNISLSLFNEAWNRVHEANMSKQLGNKDRKTNSSNSQVQNDAIKPEAWKAPLGVVEIYENNSYNSKGIVSSKPVSPKIPRSIFNQRDTRREESQTIAQLVYAKKVMQDQLIKTEQALYRKDQQLKDIANEKRPESIAFGKLVPGASVEVRPTDCPNCLQCRQELTVLKKETQALTPKLSTQEEENEFLQSKLAGRHPTPLVDLNVQPIKGVQLSSTPDIPKCVLDALELSERKAKDYDSDLIKREHYFPFGLQSYVTMLNMKTLRLISLLTNGREPQHESIEDSLKDLLNYTIFTLTSLNSGD